MTSTVSGSQPWLHQAGREIQKFGTVRQFPLVFRAMRASIPASA